MSTAAPLRLVLDTNVWLDWLVFDDAVLAPLKRAQAEGAIEIFSDEACTRELVAVLNYDLGKYSLDAESQKAKLAEFHTLARPHPGARTRYWRSQPLAGSAPCNRSRSGSLRERRVAIALPRLRRGGNMFSTAL